jgi:hypothetical protein
MRFFFQVHSLVALALDGSLGEHAGRFLEGRSGDERVGER